MGKYTKTADIFFINIREINGIKERRCTSCQEWFPETAEYFYMHNKNKPEKGFHSECKKCTTKRAMKYRKEHPDKKFIGDKRYAETPAGRESKRKSYKKRYKDGTIQNWADKNKDKYKQYNEDRKHKIHLISEEEWYNCKKYFNNSCAYCGLTEEESLQKYKERLHKEHVDHKGSRYLDNCVPACKSCNSQKWKFELEEWYNKDNPNCLGYTDERLIKIHKWLDEDYKKYIKTKI